jgi:hypothetical protein
MAAEHRLTEQQEKWFASVRAGLERDTGRSLDAWIEIARSCPETTPRARLRWFKAQHGLLQNRASYVLSAAFPGGMRWDQPEPLEAALWSDPLASAIFSEVKSLVETLPDIVAGQRKGFSAWSRRYQFAAIRPERKGGAVLGLALPPDAGVGLEPPRRESWSERLKSRLSLGSPDAVDGWVAEMLRQAWAES